MLKREPMFMFKSKGRKKLMSQFKGRRRFLCEKMSPVILVRPPIDWMRLTNVKVTLYSVLLSLLFQMVILSRNTQTLTDAYGIRFDEMSRHPNHADTEN